MIGRPKFKEDDNVFFTIRDNNQDITIHGSVYIVDAYGTFEQNEEPSYDIMVEKSPISETPCLFKHIRESGVSAE